MTSASFRNPANGYTETVTHAGLWCLLFGGFYFAAKGVWTHALISFCLAFLTFGLSWLIYPFFAHQIVEKSYLQRGWEPTASNGSSATPTATTIITAPVGRPTGAWKKVGIVFLVLFVGTAVGQAIHDVISRDTRSDSKPRPVRTKAQHEAALCQAIRTYYGESGVQAFHECGDPGPANAVDPYDKPEQKPQPKKTAPAK